MQSTPTDKELRKFGLGFCAALVMLFYVILPFIFSVKTGMWPLVIAALFTLTALIAPGWLRIVYAPWMKFAYVLGRFNTTIILSLVFFLLFTPTGWLIRLSALFSGRQNSCADSYRIVKNAREKQHLEKPY